MRFSRALSFLLFFGFFCTAALCCLADDAHLVGKRGDILVVYPDEAVKRGQADNLSAIAQVMFSLRYRVDWVEAGNAGKEIAHYDKVIWCATVPTERMDTDILRDYEGYLLVLGQSAGMERFGLQTIPGLEGDLIGAAEYLFPDNLPFRSSVEVLNVGMIPDADYKNGSVDILGNTVPLVSGTERVRYIPLTDFTTAFGKALLMQEFEQWFWLWDVGMHTWAEHLVLDAVYPFSDPYRLRDMVETMVKLKMNFVISVMPIYDHAEYPAMQRFCEVLRFAQANGGAVILHSPVIQGGVDAEALSRNLTIAAKNYLDNGIYIMGLEIPSEWVFNEDVIGLLGRSRTLFFSELNAFENHSVSEYNKDAYLELGNRQIVPALKLDETGVSHIARCSTAVYLDMGMTTDDVIYSVIDAVKDAPIPMQSLWDMEQAVYFDESRYLTWNHNTLIVNGEQKFNVYEPKEIDEKFDYKRNIYYRFVANLANQNRFLIGVSSVVLMLFIFLVFQSRKQMHKRFLKKAPDVTGGEEPDVSS